MEKEGRSRQGPQEAQQLAQPQRFTWQSSPHHKQQQQQ